MAIPKPQRRAEIIRFPADASNARDELNLCEFPLAVLSDRSPKSCLELTFTDTLWDESEKKRIERKLHVSAPPKYGLPTAKDEEVLLALIHLTDQFNQFSSPTVHFTRYELIKLLGWNGGGKSYQRITESLARWKSVTLDYRNAWRDHRAKSWVSELFSIIDNVTYYEADQVDDEHEQRQLPFSSFTWNRVFFESMQAKYYKRLDFGFYQRLRTPTAKRLFRFLDKRFGTGRPHWEFDLREFAFEHIGMSRSYDVGKIKEKLLPAIHELEAEGYLQPLARDERFQKKGKVWRIRLARAAKQPPKPRQVTGHALSVLLTDRGVSARTAIELTQQFDEAAIRSQVDVFDWIIENDRESLKNPPGFLAESIRAGFEPPGRYQSKAERERLAQRKTEAAETKKQADRILQHQKREVAEQREHIQAIRAQLSPAELEAMEQEATDLASESERKILADPVFRKFQLQIMVDALIAKRFPRSQKPTH